MTTRVVDITGAAWPDTGRRCGVCGWPVLDDAETAHLLCQLDPSPALAALPAGATPVRLCPDCHQPLPLTAGVGITCHLRCWGHRKAT